MPRSNGLGATAAWWPARTTEAHEELLRRFASLVRRRYSARLYLFGSRSRGDERPDSDFDLVAVSDAFRETPAAPDHRELWREAGGRGVPLDLVCRTPGEFSEETYYGFGAVGWAKRQGELRRITATRRRRRPEHTG